VGAAARAAEPLLGLKARLLAEGVARKVLEAIEGEARAEMSLARAAALAAPWPDPSVAWEDVQDIGAVEESPR
jgi:pyruvate dehydrogenase E1 component alpha subunit